MLFIERVEERARRRRRKDREERRRELEIQRAEDAKWGRTKDQPIVRIDSQVHFPGFSHSPQDVPEVDTIIDVSPSSIESAAQHGAGPSFAQVTFKEFGLYPYSANFPDALCLTYIRCYVKGRIKSLVSGLIRHRDIKLFK